MIVKFTDLKTIQMEKTILTAGVFDLLHPGHIYLLKYIKSQFPDHKLVVGIMCDKRVQALKGPKRPIMDEDERLEMVDSVKYVDYSFIFPFGDLKKPNWYEIPKVLKPDLLIAESGSPIDADKLEEMGTKLVHFERKGDISTTKIVERIKNE